VYKIDTHTILFLGLIVIIGYFGNVFSKRTKIPESLFMIIIGLLIGPIFKLINPTDFQGMAGIFSTLAIIIILIDSGFDFDISLLIKKMFDAALFTLLVNLLITIFVGLFAYFFLGWRLLYGFLLGIVSSGTTTVMVQALLENLKVNQETKQLLVLESILNDTSLIVIALSLIGLIKRESETILSSVFDAFQDVVIQFSIGIVFAVLFFFIWLEIVKKLPKEKEKSYVLLVGLLFIMYGVVEFLSGSGVVSVLVFSLLLGNLSSLVKIPSLKKRFYTRKHIRTLKSIRLIQLDFSFFIRTFFFVFLGMITNIEELNLSLIIVAVAIIFIMISTRYLGVMFMSLIEKQYKKHAFLISTMVPRGFVATLLAFLPLREGIMIKSFTEIVLLLIFSTSIVSIFGTIIHKTQNTMVKNKKEHAEKREE
jgi:cell volume regulation protein A